MKYTYKPYNPDFPQLFAQEKTRLLSQIQHITVEHVGSTAVPKLGGKGIIDIAIGTPNIETVTKKLQELGYEYKPFFNTPDHLYFVIDLKEQRYHVHLTHLHSKVWNELIEFRDTLRNDPDVLHEYSELKKIASQKANQNGKIYRDIKDPFIAKIHQRKMHADEIDIPLSLVQKLLTEQFPLWAHLPLKKVPTIGTDHALYRLGQDMVFRLPKISWAANLAEKECFWLPQIAPFLSTQIPIPIAQGLSTPDYPWSWSIYPWIKGNNPIPGHFPESALIDLTRFIQSMHAINLTNGPISPRGVPLKEKDAETRKAIQELKEIIDTEKALTVWKEALKTPLWSKPPVWIHGDLSPGNLLMRGDQLCAVIDFGNLGLGDPACDLIIAWNLLPANLRETFRSQLKVDNATWVRGRAWALSIALIQLPYYKETNPALANTARHVIQEILQS